MKACLIYTREEPPWSIDSILDPLFLKQLPHLVVLSLSSAKTNAERPRPPRCPHQGRRTRNSKWPARSKPCTFRKVRERKAGDNKHGPCVSRMPDVRVEPLRHQNMIWVDSEVEGEEASESSEAVKADVCAKNHSHDADHEQWGSIYGRVR